MQPAKFMRPESMCYISLATQKRILLLHRPSHWSRVKTVGSFRGFLSFTFWSEALSLTHRGHTLCWLTDRMRKWHKGAWSKPRGFCRAFYQSLYAKHFPFSCSLNFLFLMLHSGSKVVADSLSFLPWDIPSAICSNWGLGGGVCCDFSVQENMEELTLRQFPEPGPKTLAAFNSCLLRTFSWGDPSCCVIRPTALRLPC